MTTNNQQTIEIKFPCWIPTIWSKATPLAQQQLARVHSTFPSCQMISLNSKIRQLSENYPTNPTSNKCQKQKNATIPNKSTTPEPLLVQETQIIWDVIHRVGALKGSTRTWWRSEDCRRTKVCNRFHPNFAKTDNQPIASVVFVDSSVLSPGFFRLFVLVDLLSHHKSWTRMNRSRGRGRFWRRTRGS